MPSASLSLKPTLNYEQAAQVRGYTLVAGVDEVGRGPLAGPVVAAAVILHSHRPPRWLPRVRDSKALSPRQRLQLFPLISKEALAVGAAVVSPQFIDLHGIVAAVRWAMTQAIQSLSPSPTYLLIDGTAGLPLDIPQRTIIKGDALSYSIASASIIAKVTRDKIMEQLEQEYTGFGFARHKGYGTPQHMEAIARLGPTPIHRLSFSPMRLQRLSKLNLP